jgi:hypothetical protein
MHAKAEFFYTSALGLPGGVCFDASGSYAPQYICVHAAAESWIRDVADWMVAWCVYGKPSRCCCPALFSAPCCTCTGLVDMAEMEKSGVSGTTMSIPPSDKKVADEIQTTVTTTAVQDEHYALVDTETVTCQPDKNLKAAIWTIVCGVTLPCIPITIVTIVLLWFIFAHRIIPELGLFANFTYPGAASVNDPDPMNDGKFSRAMLPRHPSVAVWTTCVTSAVDPDSALISEQYRRGRNMIVSYLESDILHCGGRTIIEAKLYMLPNNSAPLRCVGIRIPAIRYSPVTSLLSLARSDLP